MPDPKSFAAGDVLYFITALMLLLGLSACYAAAVLRNHDVAIVALLSATIGVGVGGGVGVIGAPVLQAFGWGCVAALAGYIIIAAGAEFWFLCQKQGA